MDLIGLPDQLVIGPRGIAAGTVELKHRRSGERQDLSVETALGRLTPLTSALSPQAGRGRKSLETPRPTSAGKGRGPRSGRVRGAQRSISDPA